MYGYFDEEVAQNNLKRFKDCTERGTYKWRTYKSDLLPEPEFVEVTHVVETHEGAKGRFIASVAEWVGPCR